MNPEDVYMMKKKPITKILKAMIIPSIHLMSAAQLRKNNANR